MQPEVEAPPNRTAQPAADAGEAVSDPPVGGVVSLGSLSTGGATVMPPGGVLRRRAGSPSRRDPKRSDEEVIPSDPTEVGGEACERWAERDPTEVGGEACERWATRRRRNRPKACISAHADALKSRRQPTESRMLVAHSP